MRRKLIVGNWKMNGSLAANAALLAGVVAGVGKAQAEVGVCPPAPYLAQCQQLLAGSPVGLGAQDVSRHQAGAFTGEVAAPMLREFGCRYVIIGHCERRGNHAETNQIVADKTVTALRAGLMPIVCVGESLAQREAGQTDSHVHAQLAAVLDALEPADLERLVIAYEPIWAIGTGVVATPEMAQAVHARLRAQLQNKDAALGAGVRILYGGSMKPDNAAELLAQPDIDGGLIGGASLKAADFLGIIAAAG